MSKPLSSPHAVGPRNVWTRLGLVLALQVLAMVPARAQTVLQDVEFAALPGNQVRIDLVFSGTVGDPKTFTTDTPARLSLDFQGVTSGLESKTVPIGIGSVHSLNAVEVSGRTRVVVNLNDVVPYKVQSRGNRVTIGINTEGAAAQAASPPPAAASGTQASQARSAPPPRGRGLRDVEFRRGPGGEGRVQVLLPSPSTRVSVTQAGRKVIAEIADADRKSVV